MKPIPQTAGQKGAIQGIEFVQKHPEVILFGWVILGAWGIYVNNGTGAIVCMAIGVIGYLVVRNSPGFDQAKMLVKYS